jgi:methanogenic corrinoid protein MtbC1
MGGDAVGPDILPKLRPLLKFPSRPKKERQSSILAKVVESEIIPRLMLAHNPPTEVAREPEPAAGGAVDGETEDFVRMVLTKESDSLVAHVGRLLQEGRSMEAIYIDILMPAARRLGDFWDDDSISFTDVTIGLSRLQQVVRTLGWKIPPQDGGSGGAQSAYFVSCTNEQHTFGLFIIEDFFRRAGWRTWIETAAEPEDVTDTAAHHWFDVIGFTAGHDLRTEAVKALIAAVRRASRNPNVFILVGGRLFIERPELVQEVGADATAQTGADALLISDKAVRRLDSSSRQGLG